MVEFKFKISNEAFNLLIYINNNGYAEYRDPEYLDINSFMKSPNDSISIESFKARNCGGTRFLITELEEHNLVESYDFSWHLTYKLTYIGKKLLDKNMRKLKLENIEKNEKINIKRKYY